MGSDQLSVWWYDFHILIFIFYDDMILLLLLMFGRGEIIPWDPAFFGMKYLQKGQKNLDLCIGGSGIQESYSVTLTGFTILLKEVVILEITIIRVVQYKHGGQILQHFGVLLLEDKHTWEGRNFMSPIYSTPKVLTMLNT